MRYFANSHALNKILSASAAAAKTILVIIVNSHYNLSYIVDYSENIKPKAGHETIQIKLYINILLH